MTDPEITALAREYAEEMCAHMEDDFIKDEAIRDNESAFMVVIERLSRRYCLVEKVQLIAHYNMAKANIKPRYLEACQYEVGATEVLESIFPEIAKEVENAQ